MVERRDQERDNKIPLSGDLAYYQATVRVPDDPELDGVLFGASLESQRQIQQSLDEDAKRLFGEDFEVRVTSVQRGSATITLVVSIIGVVLVGIADYDEITRNLGRFSNFIAREVKGVNHGVRPEALEVRTGWTPSSAFSLVGVSLSLQQSVSSFDQSMSTLTQSLTSLTNQLRRTNLVQFILLLAIIATIGWMLFS